MTESFMIWSQRNRAS